MLLCLVAVTNLVAVVEVLRTLDLVEVAAVVTEMDLVKLDIQVVLVELPQYLEQSLLSV